MEDTFYFLILSCLLIDFLKYREYHKCYKNKSHFRTEMAFAVSGKTMFAVKKYYSITIF